MVVRRNAGPDSNRAGPPSSWNSRRPTGKATAARPIAVHPAGETACVEETLVAVRAGGCVRVHAGMAGVRPGEERSGRAGHGDAHSRLENPVAVHDAADARVEPRTIQGMRDDADELFRSVP